MGHVWATYFPHPFPTEKEPLGSARWPRYSPVNTSARKVWALPIPLGSAFPVLSLPGAGGGAPPSSAATAMVAATPARHRQQCSGFFCAGHGLPLPG